MEWMVKLIFGLMLLPFFFCLAGQVLMALVYAIGGFLLALVPWLFRIVGLIALFAGIGAGLSMRRRLPPKNRGRLPPGGVLAVKRPRGPGRDDED